MTSEIVPWDEGRQLCIDDGAEIGVLATQEEFEQVIGYFNESEPESFWMGGVYDHLTDTWSWITGEPWVFHRIPDVSVIEGMYAAIDRLAWSPQRDWTPTDPQYYSKQVLCEQDQ